MIVRWLIIICILAAVALSPRLARADDPLARPKSAAANVHLDNAIKLYGLRSFALAVEELKAGLLLEETPVFDYNLGQCFRQLEKYKEAIWHYERFLKRTRPEGKLLDAIQTNMAKMRAELNREAMSAEPRDLEPSGIRQQPLTAAASVPPVDQPARWYEDRLGWGLAGAGVIVGGASAWLLVSAADLDKQGNRAQQGADSEELYDRASSRRLFGVITAIGGGALLIGGGVKLALHARSERASTTSWNLGITRSGVLISGRF